MVLFTPSPPFSYITMSPPQAEQENELLLKENRDLRCQLRLLGDTVAKLEADGTRMERQLQEVQEAKSQAELETRTQVRQAEVKAAGLEAQMEKVMRRLDEEEAKGEEMVVRLRSSSRELEIGRSRQVELERECTMRVSEVQIEKAKEVSGLKQQMILLEHRAIDAESRASASDRQVAEMAERQRKEVERLEIEIARERKDFSEEIQKLEESKAAQMKSMAMRIEEVEEERQNYRQERDRMLRGFDEDMRMVESEREGMRRELEHLREEMEKRRKGGGRRIGEDSGSSDSSTELATKCRKYSKLIHKLREKLALTQVMKKIIFHWIF